MRASHSLSPQDPANSRADTFKSSHPPLARHLSTLNPDFEDATGDFKSRLPVRTWVSVGQVVGRENMTKLVQRVQRQRAAQCSRSCPYTATEESSKPESHTLKPRRQTRPQIKSRAFVGCFDDESTSLQLSFGSYHLGLHERFFSQSGLAQDPGCAFHSLRSRKAALGPISLS